jgi:ParB family transcriptional regulator, chromosome partitioning protein
VAAEGQPQEAAPQETSAPAATLPADAGPAGSVEAPAGAEEIEEPARSPKPGALALLKLERVDDDDAYRLRPEGEIEPLATSMARLGQLFPVDLKIKPPDRFQIVSGFRRVAALRLLKRERVLARVHTDLSDEDALRLALADLLEHTGVQHAELVLLKEKLEGEGRLTAHVKEALERVLSPSDALGPETVEGDDEEEVDLDELAQDIAKRLAGINQDLALVAELWSAMDPTLRRSLLEQLSYPEQLAAYLRSL